MTWFLGSGDAGLDMAEDGDVNGDGYGDTDLEPELNNTHGVQDWGKFGIRIRH